MPTQFKARVPYGDTEILIESDSFEELHEAMAAVTELNRDAAFLRQKSGGKPIRPRYHTHNENPYYGFIAYPHSVSFGRYKEKGRAVPFFPKGEDGYFKFEAVPDDAPASDNSRPLAVEDLLRVAHEYGIKDHEVSKSAKYYYGVSSLEQLVPQQIEALIGRMHDKHSALQA